MEFSSASEKSGILCSLEGPLELLRGSQAPRRAVCGTRGSLRSDAQRDWGQEEKEMIEDEMAGWHHRPNGREFE